MEALILSCGTGGGHNMAAKAMAQQLQRRGHTVTQMDPYQLVSQRTADRVGALYSGLVQRSPRGFGVLYSLGEAYRKLPVRSPVYWANGRLASAMERYLHEHGFDCIVMTHMYAAHILAHVQGPLPPTLLIATDYTCIPFMEESHCDWYGVPSPDLVEEFVSRGIPKEKIWPAGIPVREEFGRQETREEACARLGLPPQNRYLLLAGGEIGAGQITQSLEALRSYVQERPACRVLVICGKNRRLYDQLVKEWGKPPHMQWMGCTEDMAGYMRASDVFITKPGGLSSTEAAVLGVPLVHITPIPGCEQHNGTYFSSRGMSVLVQDPQRELLPALQALGPEERVRMVAAQKRYVPGSAAEDLCRLLEESCQKAAL